MRCGTASRPTCSKTTLISEPSRRCWVTTNWTRRRATRASQLACSPASRARLTDCRSLVRSPRKPKRGAAKTSRPHSGHVPSIAGGRGYLPRPWGSVAPGQCRPCQPRPDQGHVGRCENETCAHTVIAYNSCRNRHCPKCQGAAAREWLAEREAELLPVPYFHVVYTLPAEIADIAYQNKAVIYDLLFKASAETTLTIVADPKHLGARIGF